MQKRLEQYRGGVAWGMTMPGPKPTWSPPDDTGTGTGDDKGGEDGGDDKGDDKSGSDDKGEGKGEGRTSKLGGLFGQRSKEGDDKAGDDDDAPGDDKPGEAPKVADKFLNKDKSVNVDALAKAYSDLEKAHGELRRSKGPGGGEVPEDASGYFGETIEVPKEVDRFQGLGSDDPGVKSWAEVCKEEGVGKDLAGRLLQKMLVKMNDHVPAPIDPEQEAAALGKNARATIDGVYVWIDGLERSGQLSESDIEVVEGLGKTASGIRFLARLRGLTGERPIPLDPAGGVQGLSREQFDEQYKQAVKDKNYKEQERLDGLRERMFPDG